MSASVTAASSAQLEFVKKVAAKLSFTPTVSSYGRTPLEQAKAMLAKHAAAGGGAAGDAELYATYAADSSIKSLLALPKDAGIWSIWITKYGMNLSRHLSQKAVDFSVRGLSSSQVTALCKAIDAVGGRSLYEANPPHVHADLVRTGAVVEDAAIAVGENKSSVLWLVVGGFGSFYGYKLLKRRGYIS